MSQSVLFRDFEIWDGEQFSRGSVLVEGERIAGMGQIEAAADTVFEGNGRLLTAGLVDIHTHFRYLSDDRYGLPAEAATFPFGVTAAVDATGMRGDAAYMDMLTPDVGVWVEIPIRDNQPMFEVARNRAAALGRYVVGYKVYFCGQATDAHPLDEIFRRADRPVMVHTTGSPVPMAEYLPLFRAGDVLTHAFHGGVHTAAEVGFPSLCRAQERGVVIDLGMAGHVHTDLKILQQAAAWGLFPDTISSDAVIGSLNRRGGRYGLTLCMSVMRHLGMPRQMLMAAVTGRAAQVVGRDWGHLSVGGPADLAVLAVDDASGFDYPDLQGRAGFVCELTMKNGVVVHRR